MTEDQQPRPSFLRSLGPLGRLWLLFALWFSCTIILATMARIPGFEFIAGGADISLPKLRLAQILYSIAVFAVPAFVFANAFSQKGLGWLGIYRSTRIQAYILGILTMLAAIAIVYWLGEFNEKFFTETKEDKLMKETANKLIAMPGLSDLFVNLFAMALIPAISEELFFRGGVQGILREWTRNKHLAVWLAAAIFSFMHFNFPAFIPRMMLGAMLGYFMVWSRTLWLPIAAHFVYNASQLVLRYIEDHGYYDFGSYVLPSVAILSAVLTAAGIFLVYRILRGAANGPDDFEKPREPFVAQQE